MTPEYTITPSKLRLYSLYLGGTYLIYTCFGLVNNFLVKPGTYSVETFADTAEQFRLAQSLDLLMYCFTIVAAWASYLATKHIQKNTALLALLFRFGEALLGCVAGMIVLMPLILLEGHRSWPAFNEEQLQTLAIFFIKLSSTLWNILFVLMGVGAFLFMYLFYKVKYIPSWLSFWGMFTYISMMLYGFVKILYATPPSELKFFMYPGALFEFTFGTWLIIKGFNHNKN